MADAGDDENQPSEPNDPANADDAAELSAHLLAKLRIIIPGYKLLSEIGRGGQAAVYKAQDAENKIVAIKILLHGPLADEPSRQRHQREVRALEALKSLKHPNIVGVISSGQTPDGYDFLVMAFIDGKPLDQYLASVREKSDSSDILPNLRLFITICDAVNAAHRHGITHRDLSPSNILVDAIGKPYVLDFGLSRTAFDQFLIAGQGNATTSGQFLGKLAYASPEQARGDHAQIDIRTDVYALGVILYQIVTGGDFPYDVGGSMVEVLNHIIHSSPARLSGHMIEAGSRPNPPEFEPPRVDPVLDAIVLKALEKEQEKRYQTAGELGREVSGYVASKAGGNGKVAVAPRQIPSEIQTPIPTPTPLPTQVRMPTRIPTQRKAGFQTTMVRAVSGAAVCALIYSGWWVSKHWPAHQPPAVADLPAVPRNTSAPLDTALPATTNRLAIIEGGKWRIDGNNLVESEIESRVSRLIFGDSSWSNYDLTLQARADDGVQGFKIYFHWIAPGDFYAFNIGDYMNGAHTLTRTNAHDPHREVVKRANDVEFHRWYDVKISVRGNEVFCYVDGQQFFHLKDQNTTHGKVGVGTFHSSATFRDIRITTSDGALLWSGLPNIPTGLETPAPPMPANDTD